MGTTGESNDRPPWEGGRNGSARDRGKGGKPHHKGTDNATGRGEGRARGTDQRKGRFARSDLPILIHGKRENIQTNLKKFTERFAFVAGVKFGDAFNCVQLGEYFTYEGEPYRNTVAHFAHQLDKLDEKIADAGSANEKKALRDRKALLTARLRPRVTRPSHPKTRAEWKSLK
jgi:hypothetical protein